MKDHGNPGLKILNVLLLFSFVGTLLVPLTGIHLHKLASTLFLLLGIVHTIAYRKKLGPKRFLLLAIVAVSFVSGILGMIFDSYPIVLQLHKVISIATALLLAVHIFVHHKKL